MIETHANKKLQFRAQKDIPLDSSHMMCTLAFMVAIGNPPLQQQPGQILEAGLN